MPTYRLTKDYKSWKAGKVFTLMPRPVAKVLKQRGYLEDVLPDPDDTSAQGVDSPSERTRKRSRRKKAS